MNNDEGGTEDEEFRVAALLDRVNTTFEVWQSTTFSCIQCHSHPYDPFKHDEYYKFMAFFNDTRDEDTYADYPLLRTYNDSMQQQLVTVVNWLKQNKTNAQLIPFSLTQKFDKGAYLNQNKMEVNINEEEFIMETEYIALEGKHNLKNAMAATSVAKLMQIRKETIRESLRVLLTVKTKRIM